MASSNPRRNKKRAASNLTAFNYRLYEMVHVLRIRPFPPQDEQHGFVKIDKNSPCFYDSCFQETAERCLLVLLCSNGSLLMRLNECGHGSVVKQFEWLQNPSKCIRSFAIDPVRAAWVIVASSDMALYLIPALAQLKPESKIINACSSWSLTNLTKMEPTIQTGKTSSIVWWHTFDDRNICIIGTEHGEVVFVDLAMHRQVHCVLIKEKITRLELMQDLNEHTTQLYIHTAAEAAWQMALEWPSSMSTMVSPSSYSSAFDMGYDMVAECGTDTILAYNSDGGKDEPQLTKFKVPAQEFNLCVQSFKDQMFIAKHLTKNQTLEIFSDYERSFEFGPEYSFHLPQSSRNARITDNLIFVINQKEKKSVFSIISKRFASAANAKQPLKKTEPTAYKAEIQSFPLSQSDTVLTFYSSSFKRPNQWKTLFPHSHGLKEEVTLPFCTIVTEGGVMECRPRLSPEHYFTKLCSNAEVGAAEALGITLDLNVHYLCELVAEEKLKERDLQTATKFYNLSECSPIRRTNNLIEFASVTDGLIYVTKVLKHPEGISSKERKRLADLAVVCYTQQVLERQKSAAFRKTVVDSFMLFLRDNFDYNPTVAMERLADHGMMEKLFEVAKTKGLIKEALQLCASRGLYCFSNSIQNMLLDRGFSEAVCKTDNGAFISLMKSEEAVKFLLMQPDVKKSFIRQLDSILFKLDESSLLLIARLFDPSRSFIKPYLEKAKAALVKRSPSTISLTSASSSESLVELADVPSLTSLFEFFLKTIVILNSKRHPLNRIPERVKIGHSSSSSLRRSRTVSSKSLEPDSNFETRAIDCGRNHIAYVSNGNDIYTWGRSSHGRLGHGDIIEEKGISVPFRVEGLSMHGIQVMSVACGAAHTIAVCREGVYSWGFNNLGQLGVGDTRRRSRPCLISQMTPKNVVAAAAGHYHTLAIDGDHNVWAWGWGIHGQLGVQSAENSKIPVHVQLLNSQKIVQVAAGHSHSVALSSKGYVFTFGAGLYGQLGIGVNTKMSTPKVVKTLIDEPIYIIACGAFETVAISEEQTIYSWGRNYKQFHICAKAESASSGRHIASTVAVDLSHKYHPEELPFRLPEPIVELTIGNWHYTVLTTIGQVYSWGCNDCGQLGHYNKTDQNTPRLVKALSRRFIRSIAAGAEFTVCVDAEGQVFVWGKADGGQLGIESGSRKDSNPLSLKKANVTILSPTAVPGLPPSSERIDDSGQRAAMVSNRRDVMFDEDAEFPDFSSIGHRPEAYAPESVLAAIQTTCGSYDVNKIAHLSCDTGQFYAASFCCEVQKRWDKAFLYGIQSCKLIVKYSKGDDLSLKKNIINLADNLLDCIANIDWDEALSDNEISYLVSFIHELFQACLDYKIPLADIENCLIKRKGQIAPVLTMVLFRHAIESRLLPFPVQLVLSSKLLPLGFLSNLSNHFLNSITSCITEQLYEGSQAYGFLSNEKESDTEEAILADRKVNVDLITTDKLDVHLKQIIENKLKFQKQRNCIFLSSVTAATVSAASSAIRGVPQGISWQHNADDRSKNMADSLVFTCNHNFPKYYIEEVILPEFKQRIQGLPKPLPETAQMLCLYFMQTNVLIPTACPCCAYNNLRQEQLHLLQETGTELSFNKSTFWEV